MFLPSLKVTVFFICLCFNMASYRGQNFRRASPPLSYAESPPGVHSSPWIRFFNLWRVGKEALCCKFYRQRVCRVLSTSNVFKHLKILNNTQLNPEFECEGEGVVVGAYSRLGAYSRWALIRGWALIRINTVYIEKYLQLKYTVSIPDKISICLIRGRMESLGNDDVSIVRARK